MQKKEGRMQTIAAGRARYAWECAKEGVRIAEGKEIDGQKYNDKMYGSYIKRLPELIKTNGLGAALAFVFSKRHKNPEKEKNAYDLIYYQIQKWLEKPQNAHLWGKSLTSGNDLIEKIVTCKSPEYRALTIEVMALLSWIRRFVEGLSEEEYG